jgi:hypothetical protein
MVDSIICRHSSGLKMKRDRDREIERDAKA